MERSIKNTSLIAAVVSNGKQNFPLMNGIGMKERKKKLLFIRC